MALSLVFLAGCMVDYAAKFALLICLWQQPHLRAHFTALATVHIAANMHGTYAHCRSGAEPPRGVSMIAAVLLFGVLTPLMQAVHVLDTAAGWWTSQDVGRRPALRPAPLDVILEGLAFMCCAVHLRIGLILGHSTAPDNMPSMPLTFEALLALTLTTSLVSTATGLVLWDSTVSIKLSRDMYGWPGRCYGRGGARGGCLFLAHLAFRCSEVAGKSALLAIMAALWGLKHTAWYVALAYSVNMLVLMVASHREAWNWHLGEAAVLAWPLLFANLPQFVDCPKHSTAAKRVAGIVCGLRALELAIACSIIVATILLEAELEDDQAALSLCHGSVRAVQGMRTLRTLYRRSAAAGWGFCLLAHYMCIATRWCGFCGLPALCAPVRGLAGVAAGGLGRLPTVTVGRRGGHPPTWPDPPDQESGDDKDFWPPAASLAPLLLAAACERAPVASSLITTAPSASGLCAAFRVEPRLRMEDFEIIRLIGCGEFGKVFQVCQRSTRQFYAMKRLSKEFYAQKRMTDKAIREISTLSLARNNPFVVKLIYTIETSREWAMVMEYCPHGDLQQLLLAEGFPGLALDRTLWISAEVVLALEYLHTNGIVFRDLKLENVVLDKEGHAKLTDFGLAKQHQGGRDAVAEAELAGGVYKSFARTFCGSYGYAAPEVNPRRQVHGFAADLYSLGVLILMMLMGGEVYHDKREPPYERRLPPETPSELRDVTNILSFDFYWASHHLLQPARAAHRVEVNLDGEFVVVPRGPRGVRRQPRPHRPPNSPRVRGAEGEAAALAGRPPHFPTLASTSCEAAADPLRAAVQNAEHRWDLALDLIRFLTHELPEQRGTVATVKRHAFFVEEIPDWRRVYPRRWLVDRVKDGLLAPRAPGAARGVLSEGLSRWLDLLSSEELLLLEDDADTTVEMLEQRCAESPIPPLVEEAPPPPEGGLALEADLPGHDRGLAESPGALSPPVTRASSSGSPTHSWCMNYP